MALNKDTLGQALYDAEQQFNDKAPADLGDLATARLNFWKVMANEIIEHFKTAGDLHVPGLGLTAGSTPVSGNSVTGKIQ
jgi:hypothetical protein